MSVPAWLEGVPRGWAVAPLGARYEVQLGKMLNPDAVTGNQLFPYLRNTDVQWGAINVEELPQMAFDATERAKFSLRPGDLIVCEGGEVGRCALWEGALDPCFYQKALHRLRPRTSRDNTRFLYYAMHAAQERGAFETGNKSTIAHLPAERLRVVRFPFPQAEVQRAIADFLDSKTAALDALIAKKERLLELLAEKRQALITQAVTKGLDEGVEMKESGVEWIGAVPAHWTVRPLKFLGLIHHGLAKGRDLGEKATVRRPYLRVANVQNGYLDLEDMAEIEVTFDEARRFLLAPGDVLMNEGGDFDKLGRGYVWEGQVADCLHQNHVFAFRPRVGVDPYWINFATQASYLRHFFMLRSKQSTNLASISSTNLGEAPVVCAPSAETKAILAHLSSALAHHNRVTATAERQIALLREYRQALITAAVTGQLDVTTSSMAAA